MYWFKAAKLSLGCAWDLNSKAWNWTLESKNIVWIETKEFGIVRILIIFIPIP